MLWSLVSCPTWLPRPFNTCTYCVAIAVDHEAQQILVACSPAGTVTVYYAYTVNSAGHIDDFYLGEGAAVFTADLSPFLHDCLNAEIAGINYLRVGVSSSSLTQQLQGVFMDVIVEEKPQPVVSAPVKNKKVRQSAKIEVVRNIDGLTVTVFAPEIAKALHERLEARKAYIYDFDLPAGQGTTKCYDAFRTGANVVDAALASSYDGGPSYGVTGYPNMWFLRTKKALTDAITITFPGVYSRDAVDQFTERCIKFFRDMHRDVLVPYRKALIVNVEEAEA